MLNQPPILTTGKVDPLTAPLTPSSRLLKFTRPSAANRSVSHRWSTGPPPASASQYDATVPHVRSNPGRSKFTEPLRIYRLNKRQLCTRVRKVFNHESVAVDPLLDPTHPRIDPRLERGGAPYALCVGSRRTKTDIARPQLTRQVPPKGPFRSFHYLGLEHASRSRGLHALNTQGNRSTYCAHLNRNHRPRARQA